MANGDNLIRYKEIMHGAFVWTVLQHVIPSNFLGKSRENLRLDRANLLDDEIPAIKFTWKHFTRKRLSRDFCKSGRKDSGSVNLTSSAK